MKFNTNKYHLRDNCKNYSLKSAYGITIDITTARATPGSASPEETRRLLAAAKSAETAVRVHWDTLTHRRTHTLDMLKTTLAAALA